MTVSEATIRLLVEGVLPVGAEFGRENFAGDKVVKDFFEWSRQHLKVNPNIYVSWSCLPDVMILKIVNSEILVRSERFDTLLVEYLQLKLHIKLRSGKLSSKIWSKIWSNKSFSKLEEATYRTVILRWMSEFFLGHQLPCYALYAVIESHEI